MAAVRQRREQLFHIRQLHVGGAVPAAEPHPAELLGKLRFLLAQHPAVHLTVADQADARSAFAGQVVGVAQAAQLLQRVKAQVLRLVNNDHLVRPLQPVMDGHTQLQPVAGGGQFQGRAKLPQHGGQRAAHRGAADVNGVGRVVLHKPRRAPRLANARVPVQHHNAALQLAVLDGLVYILAHAGGHIPGTQVGGLLGLGLRRRAAGAQKLFDLAFHGFHVAGVLAVAVLAQRRWAYPDHGRRLGLRQAALLAQVSVQLCLKRRVIGFHLQSSLPVHAVLSHWPSSGQSLPDVPRPRLAAAVRPRLQTAAPQRAAWRSPAR